MRLRRLKVVGGSEFEPRGPLVLHAPALDGYFQELAQLWSADKAPSREQELELMQRHGMKPAG